MKNFVCTVKSKLRQKIYVKLCMKSVIIKNVEQLGEAFLYFEICKRLAKRKNVSLEFFTPLPKTNVAQRCVDNNRISTYCVLGV